MPSFLGLAKSGPEKPGPGATLLGWPKFIYYYGVTRNNNRSQEYDSPHQIIAEMMFPVRSEY